MPEGSEQLIRALLFHWDGVHTESLLNIDGVTPQLLDSLEKSGQIVRSTDKTRTHLVAPLLHFYWCNKLRTSSASEAPLSLDALVEQLVQRIDPGVLQGSLSRAPGKPLLEAAWQSEVYRAAYDCFPAGINISPGFGHGYGSDGAVDFLVHGVRGWAVEIMREGDRRKEHLERFEEVCLAVAVVPRRSHPAGWGVLAAHSERHGEAMADHRLPPEGAQGCPKCQHGARGLQLGLHRVYPP